MTRQERQRPQPEPVELHVLFEDDCLIALDKPAGMVVHPTYKNTSGTLLNGVLWRYRDRPDVQPGILTRLDKDTSGIVIVALTAELHARMQRERIRKEYLAVAARRPDPPSGTITLPLARSPEDRRRVIVTDAGQPCETRYEVIRGLRRGFRLQAEDPSDFRVQAEDPCILKCELVTGRTHQIRVHLAAIGAPIVGDAVYGEPSERIGRQALHAWRVTLTQPRRREQITIEAALPDDMRLMLRH